MENVSYCRVRPKSNYFYAKPIYLKDGVSEEDVKKKGVVQLSSKNFKECFDNGFVKTNPIRLSKWDAFRGVYGVIDVAMLDDKMYAEYMIDFKIGMYSTIIQIIKNEGFKYSRRDSLKRHIYLVLKEKYFKRFNDNVIRYTTEYFFNKSADSYNARKKRFIQKAFTNKDIWNYFVTFTYDPKIFEKEENFESFLRNYLRHLSSRDKVKYMGAFEKSIKGRLHFHCIMACTDEYLTKLRLEEESYYDKTCGEVKTTIISSTLKNNIGRCEFKRIYKEDDEFLHCLDYICKYISKQENYILYARGLKDELIGKVDDFRNHVVGFTSLFSTFFLMDGSSSYKQL